MPSSDTGTYIWDVDHQEWKNLGNFIGEQGAKGDTGDTGPQGPAGTNGVTPTILAQASLVEDGGAAWVDVTKTGTDIYPNFSFTFHNIKGPKGDTGAQGPRGIAGAQGAKGDTGATGPTGPQGPAGADGQDGAQGPAGADGITPNISATATVGTGTGTPSVTITKTGTTAAPSFNFAFDNLKGAKGDTGATGAQGPAGPAGATGAQGPKGDTGATGPQGPAGQDGAQGPQGEPGANGADGTPGVGVPAGGSAGQVLAKASGSDYDTTWVNPSSGGSSNIITLSSVILGDNGNGLAPTIPNVAIDEVSLPQIINISAVGELWDLIDLRAYLRWRGDGVNPYTWWDAYAGGGSGALYNRTINNIVDVNKWYSVDGFYLKEVLTGSNLKFETSEVINGAGAQVLTITPKMRKGHALYPRYLSEVLNSQVVSGYVQYQNGTINRVVPTSGNSTFKTFPVPYYVDEEHPTDPAYNHTRNIDVMYTYTLKKRV